MARFHRRPFVFEAITFDELVEIGKASGCPLHNGMPWSFKYQGHPITHENDNEYLIPSGSPTAPHQKFRRGDMLVTAESGALHVYTDADFAAAFKPIA